MTQNHDETPFVGVGRGEPRLTKILHWVRGERALASALAGLGVAPRPLAALEVAEKLSGLLASTSVTHAERVRRLAPKAKDDPVPLVAAARSLRFYLPLEAGDVFELEATLLAEPGDLAVVHFEARLPTGERAATGELRYLLVPASADHAQELEARAALKASLDWKAW